jgi:hypothetical protein
MVRLPATPQAAEARGAWLETVESLIIAVAGLKDDAQARKVLDTDLYGASEAIHAAPSPAAIAECSSPSSPTWSATTTTS